MNDQSTENLRSLLFDDSGFDGIYGRNAPAATRAMRDGGKSTPAPLPGLPAEAGD
jgi:hypothetical protein